MPNINYAIEVQSGTSLTDTSKGISAGVFYFISGLFSRLGVSPSGDTSQASWYENLIKSMSSVSKRVDVESGGRYATLSGFSFDIDNSIKFSVWLEAQGISLYKKIVKVYYVKDGVFYLDWTGQVDRISISHSAVKIQCIDIFKSIHRDCPPILFSKIANPLIQNSIIGKPVPICLGLVNNAKLFNTEVNTNKTVLYIDPATSDQASVCACSAYTTSLTATSVTLKTGSKVFSTDDLKDQWLVTILGSAKEGIRIINNTASSGGLTILSLEKGKNDKIMNYHILISKSNFII